MPVVTFDYNDFINLFEYKISKEELIEKLPMIGADLDRVEGDAISIEFFPNRPDLASVEGIARAAKAFFEFKKGITNYDVKESDIVMHVDSSVKKVRPFVVTALVKDVTMTDELISSLMDLQEKLHGGLGRNRKKVAIGVHNYEPITPPFTYKAVDPNAFEFVPLNKIESMTLTEILENHEKGVDYAHLLKECDKHPLIVDSNNNVLSYPPIINGSLTEVTPFTTDLFIDVTGNDEKSINYALNIVTTALSDRGGKIYSTKIIDAGKEKITPDLKPIERALSVDYVNKILGTQLDSKKISDCLEKMGYKVEKKNDDNLNVFIPAYRADILHEIDLIEDVAIGFGYDIFDSDIPKSLTFGKSIPTNDVSNTIRNIMIGLGFNEVTTFTISNERDEFEKIGLEKQKRTEIKNPIGEEYTSLRVGLLSSLLKILKENRHHPLPQQIFEVGIIVDEDFKNKKQLGFVKIDAKANFTECKSYMESVLRETGKIGKIKSFNHPGFVNGRCANIIVDDKIQGFFGELHPRTITGFELEHPIIAFQMNLDLF